MASKCKEGINKEKVCSTWNEHFPQLNMRVSDLTNPTEAFLTKTFVFYLRAFGYKIDPSYGESGINIESNGIDNGREKRLFLIKLTRNIEHILQITLKTLTFSYYDMIKPTPKKTINTLSILFNYLCYFNMYKNDVFEMAEERIKLREDLMAKITNVRTETEHRQERTKLLKNEILEISELLDTMTQEMQTLSKENENVQHEVNKLGSEVDKLNIKRDALDAQQRHWKKLIVPMSEIDELHFQMNKLKSEIVAYQQEAADHEASLKERKLNIKNDEELCKLIAEAQEVIPKKTLVELKELTNELKQVSAQNITLENKKKELLTNIEQQNQKLELLSQQLEARKSQFEKEKQPIETLIKQKNENLEEHKKNIAELEEDINGVNDQIEEQKQIEETLKTFKCELMEHYKHISYKV